MRATRSMVCSFFWLVGCASIAANVRSCTVYDPPSWSPDSQRLAFVATKGVSGEDWLPKTFAVVVYDLASNKLPQVIKSDLPLAKPCWSPDGSTIAFLQVLRGASVEEKEGLRLSIVLYDYQQRVTRELLAVASSQLPNIEQEVRDDPQQYHPLLKAPLLWTPDGKGIVYSNAEFLGVSEGEEVLSSGVYEIDLAEKEPRLLVEGAVAYGFSPDGKWLACQEAFASAVFVLSRDGNRRREVYERELEAMADLAWFADSRSVLLVEPFAPGTDDVLLRVQVESGEKEVVREKKGEVRWPACSPDGSKIAFCSVPPTGAKGNAVIVLDLKTGLERVVSAGPKAGVENLAPVWSPDRKWIAFRVSKLGWRGSSEHLRITSCDGKEVRMR